MFYDTVTVSSCLRSQADSANAYSVFNRTNCLCGPLKSSIYSSWPSTSKGHSIFRTVRQGSLLDTYYESSFPTSAVGLVEASKRRPSISHSTSTFYSSVKGKYWKSEVLQSPDTFSSVKESSCRAEVLQSSDTFSSTKEWPWKSEIVHSSGTFTSLLKEKSPSMKILRSSDMFASSFSDIPWKTDILQSPNAFSISVKDKPQNTEVLQSSSTLSSSLLTKSGKTLLLSSYFSKIHGVKNESRNADSSYSTQTAQIDGTSTGFLFTSRMPVGCREKGINVVFI